MHSSHWRYIASSVPYEGMWVTGKGMDNFTVPLEQPQPTMAYSCHPRSSS
jgi:hypothetical protein